MENKKLRVIYASTIRELVKQVNDYNINPDDIVTVLRDGEYYVVIYAQ